MAVHMETTVRSKLIQVLKGKFACFEHLPLKLMGCFAQFHCCSAASAKQCAKECFQEFSNIDDMNQMHPVAYHLLAKSSAASKQLWEWSIDEDARLQSYPEALEALQEVALVPIVELPAEGEHRQIQVDMTEHSRPATVCASLRNGAAGITRYGSWHPSTARRS